MADSNRANPTATPARDLTGRTLGDFRLLRLLGQGGMGEVYLADQISLQRQVALKVLREELVTDGKSARFRPAMAAPPPSQYRRHTRSANAMASTIAREYVPGRTAEASTARAALMRPSVMVLQDRRRFAARP